MSHVHEVIDTDVHYKIDGLTRTITNIDEAKRELVQNDHNSERFTFEIPRYVDGHDFSECNLVQIHFENKDTYERNISRDFYTVDDLHVKEDDEETVVLSWLIPYTATKYVGTLDFVIRFACTNEKGEITYVWNTTVFKGITILPGIFNSEEIIKQYPDVFSELFTELQSFEEALENSVAKELIAENIQAPKVYMQDLKRGIYSIGSNYTGTGIQRIQLFAGTRNIGIMGKGTILIVSGEETTQNCKSNFNKGYIIIQVGANSSAATQLKFGTLSCTCNIGEDETVSWTYESKFTNFLGIDQKITNIVSDDVDVSLIPTVGAIKNYIKSYTLKRYEEIDTYTVTEEGISRWEKDSLSLREIYLIVKMPTPEGSQDTLPKLSLNCRLYNRTNDINPVWHGRNLGQVTEATTDARYVQLYTRFKLDNYSYEIKSFLHNFNTNTNVEIDEIVLTNDDIYDAIQKIAFSCDSGKYFPVGTEITLMGAKVT